MITGPRHALLQVQLGRGEQGVPVWDTLPAVDRRVSAALDSVRITMGVLRGLEEANRTLGTAHTVTHIRCVEDDNGSPSMYGQMLRKLIEHIHASP
jgi:hypothetical protein